MFGQELIQFVIVFLRELLWVDGSQNTLPWVYLLHYQLYVFLTYMERRRLKAVFWTVVAPAVPIGCFDTCWQSVRPVKVYKVYRVLSIDLIHLLCLLSRAAI